MARLKKTELTEHANRYRALTAEAQHSVQAGYFSKALESATSALGYVDGMMQYAGRYEDASFESIEAIEIITKYAPLLLDSTPLRKTRELLDDVKRVEKDTSADLYKKLDSSSQQMKAMHRVFDHLERSGASTEDELLEFMEFPKKEGKGMLDSWVQMSILSRRMSQGSIRLDLATRLNGLVFAKCSICGAISDGPKAIFLEETTCPKCTNSSHFCIVPEDQRISA